MNRSSSRNPFPVLLVSGFVLSAFASEFPPVYNSELNTNLVPTPPAVALERVKLPAGFQATLFAAEPEVQNPIAMTWDARGRLWVAENYTYAERALKFDLRLRDRVLIFEDRDGDGRFDSRTVFTDEIQRLTSVEVGHGGVWLMCPPQLLFLPDRDGDGRPDGPAEVVLDGFTVPPENYHNFANGLRWGPDGWLYGRCGASAPGWVGPPGSPEAARVPIHGALWRYHPTRKVVEVLTSGPMNSWGHDWNEYGEAFCVNTVVGHFWEVIPGAHYYVAHTLDPNSHSYELLDMHADHWHFDTAKGWTASRDGAANDLGGGHAHSGAMVYLGDNWPAHYRGHFFTLNFHGRRINQEILERAGSGYVAKHGRDEFLFGDDWFRGLDLSYGPDGGVYAIDWNDTGECHETTGVYRTSGRVYKITYGQPKSPGPLDLSKMSVAELVSLHRHPNEWYVRQARLQLAARATTGPELATAQTQLRAMFSQEKEIPVKLRALWSLYAIGGTDPSFLRAQLRHPAEPVRTWAIRLLSDDWPLDTELSKRPTGRTDAPDPETVKQFQKLAQSDPSGLVRLALATVLQRLPVSLRAELASPLLRHPEDANDHNLPLMLWYGLIPLGESDPRTLAKLAARCELPVTRKLIARRLGEDLEKNPGPVNDLLELTLKAPESVQSDLLAGLAEALRGWRKAPRPPAWPAWQAKLAGAKDPKLRDRGRDLSALFGDGRALDEVRRVALDDQADLAARRAAVLTLIDNRPPDLRQICERLLSVKFLNSTAVRGLAFFDDPEIGEKLAGSYLRFHPSERPAVMETLASRPSFAHALLDEMAAGRIPRLDLSPYYARQIRSFKDVALSNQLVAAWGQLRDSPAGYKEYIDLTKARLTPAVLAAADKSAGRKLYTIACATCHTLFGEGAKVGPDLTGSNRDNIDYLLENIVDPSAVVNADYRMSVVEMKDDRILNGLIAEQTDHTITLQTISGPQTLERSEIGKVQSSTLSIMPEGLLESLTETQSRDLIAYLMSPTQVP